MIVDDLDAAEGDLILIGDDDTGAGEEPGNFVDFFFGGWDVVDAEDILMRPKTAIRSPAEDMLL